MQSFVANEEDNFWRFFCQPAKLSFGARDQLTTSLGLQGMDTALSSLCAAHSSSTFLSHLHRLTASQEADNSLKFNNFLHPLFVTNQA
ncbi:hypothetical protein TcWFU_000204 [Taenia crassiceps]|uniref:Uncharacterized protein n=1 Tax=Taenia crassiceps TaxID=6207 RepID=A0ABR4QJC3_9CEST